MQQYSLVLYGAPYCSSSCNQVCKTLHLSVLKIYKQKTFKFIYTLFLFFLTLWKFVFDLNEPYVKIKAFLMNNRPVRSIEYIKYFNEKILNMPQEDRSMRKWGSEPVNYFMVMNFELFHELCSLVNVNYLVRGIWTRVLFTLFILFMFFLGIYLSFIFLKNQELQSFLHRLVHLRSWFRFWHLL